MPAIPAMHNIEKGRLELSRNRPRFSFSDGSTIHLADWRDLRSCAGKECLIGNIQFIPRETVFYEAQATVRGDLHDSVSRDTFEDRRQRRGLDQALTHNKHILSASFSNVTLGIEQHGLVVSVLKSLALGK